MFECSLEEPLEASQQRPEKDREGQGPFPDRIISVDSRGSYAQKALMAGKLQALPALIGGGRAGN